VISKNKIRAKKKIMKIRKIEVNKKIMKKFKE